MNKIYYAHHILKYDTPEEKKEIKLIEEKFPDDLIINPNGWVCQSNTEQAIMNQCYHFVEMSEIFVFSSMNSIIGQGVYEETKTAFRHKKPVYFLFNENFYKINAKEFSKVNIIYDKTKNYRKYASVDDLIQYLDNKN